MDEKFKHFRNSLGFRYCTIRYLNTNGILSVIWKGTASEASIKDVKDGILEMVKKYKCDSVMNDVQDFFNAPSQVLATLAETEWDSEVKNLGVRFIAHVLKPDDDVTNFAYNETTDIEVNYFVHKMDAVDWLKQKKES